MRFLLDENVPRTLAGALAERGHDAVPLPEHLRRSKDSALLAYAARTRRTLVTQDTDFGTLVFVTRRRPPPAIVLLRLPSVELVERVQGVVVAMEAALARDGVFVVIDRSGVRIRPLPRR